MWHTFLAYIKYKLKAKSKYSIHSPFVFDFVTKALESNLDSELFNQYIAYRNTLLKDKGKIEVRDHGAGSKVFKGAKRSINKIAKVAGISPKKAKLLLKITHYFQPKNILELGTSLGMSTICLSKASPDAQITSIEGCPETAQKAREYLENFQVSAKIITDTFENVLPGLCKKNKYDLILFDGNHQLEPTLKYFNICKNAVKDNTLFIFDDIHWNKEMEMAWKKITQDEQIHVSIDLFHYGLAFFRKGQDKQHFIIK